MKQFVTPYQYAKLCGVSTQNIYQRIKRKTLTTITKQDANGDLVTYVDTVDNPPKKREPAEK